MNLAHSFFVYIVQCADESYYSGVTNNMERRLWEHNNNGDNTDYNHLRGNVELRYCECYHDVKQATDWEKQINEWPSKKKESLFKNDWDEVIRLTQFKAFQ